MNKAIAVASFMFAFVSLLTCQENPPSAQPESSVVENFVGSWKFNADKSSHSGTERESINIELADGACKFTYDWLAENGTELNWWFVTDMKGGCVKHTQVNGQPMTSTSCVTLLSTRKFIDEVPMLRDEYEVSSDRRTLKLHRKFKVPPTVHMSAPKDATLVFDRVSR